MRFSLKTSPDKGTPLAAVVLQGQKGFSWSRGAKGFPPRPLAMAHEDGLRWDKGSALVLRPPAGNPTERLLLLCAGDPAQPPLHPLRGLAAIAAETALNLKWRRLNFLLPEEFGSPSEEAQAAAEGALLGGYRFERHKSRPPARGPLEMGVVAPSGERGLLRESLRLGETFGDAANFARDLVNEPPSLKRPEVLGRAAQGLAARGLTVRVYRKAELERMKMNALLGVNRGSAHPPVLVHLHYKPAGRPKRRVALVGKGITFDSGGLSLKTAEGMMTMKYDMAGAAAVFAVFRALGKLRPDVEVHGVAPVTENMPGHDAYKPGDVVRALNGKTIEVLNTDAEGRIVLADALSFAARLPVDEIIDAATLTGAASVALGRAYACLMTRAEKLGENLRQAAEKAGEKIWPLPLEPLYKDHIKSQVADLKNIGNAGEAGTIIGGLFLQEFVGEKDWAHLDIAGCAWNPQPAPGKAAGATGAMVRTLLYHLID